MKNIITEELIKNRLEKLDVLNSKKYEPISFLSLAELYYDVFEGYICYNSDWGCPMEFEGVKWQICKNLSVYTTLFVKALIKYTAGLRTPLSEFAFSLTKPSKARTLESQFKTLLDANVAIADFDSNPYSINTESGVYDFLTGTLKKPDSEQKFLKSVNASLDSELDGDNRWKSFIFEIMSDDEKKADFLQRVLGYCLLGEKIEDKFFIFHGATTRNGKSTLMSAVMEVLGDYATDAQAATFCETYACRNPAGPSSDIARLAGTRLCHVPEPPKNFSLDISKIKQLTGGDTVIARFLNKNEFSFKPQFGLIFTTNHLPRVTDTTVFDSYRVIVIPFEKHFSPDEQDSSLRELFKTEEYKNIILKWLIEGARKYLAYGLENLPESIQKATEKYALLSNSTINFLRDCITPSEGSYCSATEIYEAYLDFCEASKITPDGKHGFMQKLREEYDVIAIKKIGKTTISNVIENFKIKK